MNQIWLDFFSVNFRELFNQLVMRNFANLKVKHYTYFGATLPIMKIEKMCQSVNLMMFTYTV
jgi:hypothetical protein